MEILSPCKNFETLKAAVNGGADSVYFGAKEFNARRKADNFTDDELMEAVQYCHLNGVKAYLTFNTIIFDDELEKAAELLKKAVNWGFDAIIVQDMALVKMVKENDLSIHLHASTQMSAHNIWDVLFLEKLGFKRVVLARELSLKEIAYIRKETNVELEVFVHGALCMSISGQCFFSASLGPRSANRGLCAGVCRLPFSPMGKKGEYALSLKDNCLIDSMDILKKIGVDCVKIEGRMKDALYVEYVTSQYKSASLGKSYSTENMKKAFSRQGFTDGYFTSKIDSEMFGVRSENDKMQSFDFAKNMLLSKEPGRVEVSFAVAIDEDGNSVVRAKDIDGNVVTLKTKSKVEKAIKRTVTPEDVKKAFLKLGQSVYYSSDDTISVSIPNGVFISAAELNLLRRSVVGLLGEKRTSLSTDMCSEIKLDLNGKSQPIKEQTFLYMFSKKEQVPFDKLESAKYISLPTEEIQKLSHDELLQIKGKLFCEIQRIDFERTLEYSSVLKKTAELGVLGFICHTVGAILAAKSTGLKLVGGYGLNISNSYSLNFYCSLGLSAAFIGLDAPLSSFQYSSPCEKILFSYGYIPVMTFRNCPVKSTVPCQKCKGKSSLRDRMGKEFAVVCKNKKIFTLLNSVATLSPLDKKVLEKIDVLSLSFTKETKEEVREIIEKYPDLNTGEKVFTKGMNFKRVE